MLCCVETSQTMMVPSTELLAMYRPSDDHCTHETAWDEGRRGGGAKEREHMGNGEAKGKSEKRTGPRQAALQRGGRQHSTYRLVTQVLQFVLVDQVAVKDLHRVLDGDSDVLARAVKLGAVHALALAEDGSRG